MRREWNLKLKTPPSPGKAFSTDEKILMLEEAKRRQERSPSIYPALVLALNAGLRDKELRELRWAQIDMVAMDTVFEPESRSHVFASFTIEDGSPGPVRT